MTRGLPKILSYVTVAATLAMAPAVVAQSQTQSQSQGTTLSQTQPHSQSPTHAQPQQPDVQTLLGHYGCTLCHADRDWLAAPSWVDIAAEYRKDRRASSHLMEVVRKGKHGDAVWPMPPLPEVTEADAKRIVNYILTMTQ